MKVNLGEALLETERLCDLLEEEDSDPSSKAAKALSDHVEGKLAHSCDKFLESYDADECYIEYCEEKEKYWSRRTKKAKYILETKKAYLLDHLAQTKLTAIRGTEGGFKIYRNSQPKLILKVPTEKFNLNYTLPNNMKYDDLLSHYPEFFKSRYVTEIDSDSLKKALMDGRVIDFAGIEYGHHVRRI